MNSKLLVSSLSVLLLAGTGFAAEKKQPSAEAKLQVTQCDLKVSGMTCGGCATAAEAVLARIHGVKSAKVDFNSAEAKVEYDPKVTTPEKIVAAFNEGGAFRAELSKGKTRQSSRVSAGSAPVGR